MAEFALGLTKTALEGTVSRVKSAIDEEAKLRVRVQNDLVFITGEFEMMQSFLNVANKERAKNEVVRTWVRQIRNLAFDVEDCVELVVSLDVKSGWSWLWRVVPGCMAPPKPLDHAVAEVQRLKARVEDVCHRNTRYNLINDSGSSSNSNSKHAPAPTTADASSSTFNIILHEVWEATGKMRGDMGGLTKLIANEGSDLEVISLWGPPGSAADLGKTHVIREVYNDPKIRQEFKCRAWVKVVHPFNHDEFLKGLLTQLDASSHRDANIVGGGFRKKMKAAVVAMEDELTQLVHEQRYLVILEQLCTVVDWDAIRMYLPDAKNGSRIVVTTHQLGLALSCTGEPYQASNLRQLSDGQSLYVFFNKVPGRRSDVGEFIWKLRCGGVISFWGWYHGRSTILDEVYMGLTHKPKVFESVEFKRHNWVEVPDPFKLRDFSRRLFLNFHSHDLRARDIVAAGTMGDKGVIEACCKFLREEDCLVVINGLSAEEDWNMIKATFLSEPTRGCIIVFAAFKSVAQHCVEEDNRAQLIDDLHADVLLGRSIKGCKYYGIGANEASSRGRFLYNREKEAIAWRNKFQHVLDPRALYYTKLRSSLYSPGVISMWGSTGAWQSALAREVYYEQMVIEPPKRDVHGFDIDNLDFKGYMLGRDPLPYVP